MASTTPAPRNPRAPAVWVGLVLLALLGTTAVLGRPAGLPEGGAAAWLPPDGSRQRFAGPGGTISVEWAVDGALPILAAGPAPFFSWLSRTNSSWDGATLARVSSVLTSSSGEVQAREDDLFSVTEDGVRAAAEVPLPGTVRLFLPGRLDVPRGLMAGRSWVSQGQVVEFSGGEEQTLPLRADYTASTPEDHALVARGCVVVTMREQVGDRPATTTEQTWCRHAGLQSFRTSTGAWGPDAPQPPAPAPGVPAGLDWRRAPDLAFSALAINRAGTLGSTLVSPASPPGVLDDGTLVFDNQTTSHDLLALSPDGDPPQVIWRGRPGGRVTASAAWGTVAVAASSSRSLVAYGPFGRWLWEQRLSDLALVPPVRLGDAVVVPTLDGEVTAFDLASGRKLWSHTTSAEVRVAPVATADRVLVADQAGELTCLDATGTVRWTADVPRAARFAVWTPGGGGDPVVLLPEAGGAHVRALSLADGERLWRVREFTDARDIVVLDDAVVLRDQDETVALDPLTGARTWSWRGARTYAGVGGAGYVLLLTADRLLLLDQRGSQAREWPVDVGDVTAATSFLVAGGRRVLVYGPGGVATGVLP